MSKKRRNILVRILLALFLLAPALFCLHGIGRAVADGRRHGGLGEGSEDVAAEGATGPGQKSASSSVPTELEAGRAYLESLESRSLADMEVAIDEAREIYRAEQERALYAAKRDAYRETIEGDGVWDAFEEYAFLGDSRVVGFDVFGFLPSDRVLAASGDTILAIDDRLDALRALSPRYIFISYGINDIGIGFWPTDREYAEAFSKKLDLLQEALPDAQIYVNSILPARQDAVDGHPVWGGLPAYSEAIRKMCGEKGVSFVDNGSIVAQHEDLYATDGVHMQPAFYSYWAQNQLLAVFDRQNGHLSFP